MANRSIAGPPVTTLNSVITAVHTLVYADDAEAARAFFRDVIGWPHVDAHDGWLIFNTGPSELGVHPTSGGSDDGTWSAPVHHEISLMCDDIEKTVAALTSRGAVFTGGVSRTTFGLTARLQVPGAGEMLVYQPTHRTAYNR
jgi:predicted enzyme related to lactoylglutathione lyase